MTESIARPVGRMQMLPMAIASLGICLGIWVAREQWTYSLALIACLSVVSLPIEATLGIYACLLPFDSITRLGTSPDGRTITFYVGALATIALIGVGLLRDRLQAPPRMSWYWLGFAAWAILSVFWALDEDAVFTEVPTLIGLLLLYGVAVSFRVSRQQLSRINFLAIVGGLAASLLSISNFLSGVTTIEARSSLISGSQQADPNIFAASLLIPLALALAEFMGNRGLFEKVMMLLAALTIVVAILLTMSRGAVLALIGMAVVFLVRSRPRPAALVGMVAVGSTMSGLGMLYLPPLFLLRFKHALETGGAGRLDIWVAGWSALKHFFVQGAGMANFEIAYQQFAGFAPTFRGYSRAAHNIYLQIAVELGLIGAVLFVWAISAHIRRLHSGQPARFRPPDPLVIAAEAMVVGMLVSAFFVGLLWQKSFWMVWIFAAFATQRINQEDRHRLLEA